MEIRESEKAMAGYRQLRVVLGAQVATLFGYALLVEWLTHSGFTAPALIADPLPVRVALLLVSAGLFLLSGRIRERMLQPRFDALEQALVPAERLRRMLTANVIAFALCDVAAVFGLLLFLLGGARSDFYVFVVLSAIFLALRYPDAAQWQAWYAQRARLR